MHGAVSVVVAAVTVTVDVLHPDCEQSTPAVVTVTVAEGEHLKLDPDDTTAVTVIVFVTVVVTNPIPLDEVDDIRPLPEVCELDESATAAGDDCGTDIFWPGRSMSQLMLGLAAFNWLRGHPTDCATLLQSSPDFTVYCITVWLVAVVVFRSEYVFPCEIVLFVTV